MHSLSHNSANQRYEIHLDGTLAGFADYRLQGGTLHFTHTEVLPAYEGQGLAAQLMRFALDDVRAQGQRAVPVCSYVQTYLRRHPEYADLLAAP